MGLSNSLIDGGFYNRLGKSILNKIEEESCAKYDNGRCNYLFILFSQKTLTESEVETHQSIICKRHSHVCILNQKNKK